MNKQELVEGILFAGFRIIAMILIIAGTIDLVFQLIDSWYRFDPSYLGAWITSTILLPLLLIGFGKLLYFGGAFMARKMAARFAGNDV